MKHLLEVCILVLVSLHTVIGGCAHARIVRDDKCQGEHDGVDFEESKEGNENVFLSNKNDGEVTNSKPNAVTETIESVEHEGLYENQHSTEDEEGAGSGSEAVYWESSTESGKVLGSDNKEEREILTDQLEDTIYETNVRENKTEVSDELLKTETLQEVVFESTIKSPGLEEVQVDDFMKSRIDLETSSTENTEYYSSEGVVNSPEKLTMEETIGDVWKEYVVDRTDGRTEYPLEDTSPTTVMYRNYFNKMYPSHSKRIMEDRTKSDKVKLSTRGVTRKDGVDEGSEHVLMGEEMDMVTTDTTSTTSWEGQQNVTKEDIKYSEDVVTSTNSHGETELETNVATEISPKIPLNDDVVNSKKTNFSPSDSILSMEKLYSTETEKQYEVRNVSSKINDSESSTNPINPQPLRDYEDKSEEDRKVIKSLLDDHPSFKKEKIEPGVLFEDCPDCDLRVLPIKPSEQRSTPEDDEEPLQVVKIKFAELPESRDPQINSLGLSDGIFLFSYLSEFLSWIQPNDFPVELLRDALKNQMSWIYLITQSVQVEAGFVACLVAVVLLAFAVPVVVLSHACYRMCGGPDDQAEESLGWAGNCRRRTLVFLLQIFLVLLCGGMVAMFVTNEQLSGAVVQSSEVLQTSLGDISSFVHDSHLQLHFLVTQSIDQAMQAVHADLDNVDTLLGRPIQRELVRETGLDVALESLSDLTREAKQTTQQVERLLEEARTAQELQTAARDKLSDLRQQVELFRRACGPRDRTLCDTIDATGLDITLRLDRIKSDDRLNRMRRMGGVALEVAMTEAKERFLSIPTRVEADTRDTREEVRRQLSRERAEVDERSLALERFAREVGSKVNEAKYQAGFWMQDIDQFEYWRWIICIGGGAAMLMIWTLLLCSMCCGCCGSEKAAGPTILVTVVLLCLFSTALWTMVLAGLLVGGHGEVFLCRPLYDEPEFRVISQLVDEPGVFYDQPHGGFIANVIYGNDTLDVPIRQVLQDCRANRPIYPTLGLGRVLDVEGLVSEHQWSSVHSRVRAVSANLSSLEVLSPALQDQLTDLLTTLSVNFTEHRIQMSKPVTGKDLDSFARQLDNIGNQMRDLATASRMETLSTRTRRLIDSHIRPLEGRKDALVYQLTALEVQTGPLQRQVNQSLSHLKTIQFFINSQGENIAQKKSREYVGRLAGYVEQLRRHVVDTARDSVAPCRPLWDIFNNSRLFLCRHTMDPLNGYWFATMWCLLVLLAATPVCLKLVDYYRAQGNSISGSPSENLMGSEQGAGWSSPGYDIKCSKDPAGACK